VLKKIVIGVVLFIILAIAGVGGYIYMMDWNQHKSVVSERFAQITGLNASIEGDLKVDLLPSPKISANAVRFFKSNAPRDPLVTVKEISANVELLPMFQQKFVINSMTLTNATVNVLINEKGVSNWDNINAGGANKTGNVEVSFNNVRLNNSILNYKNLQDKKELMLPNISATVNASTIKGPYKTNGNLIYNNNEIKFQGAIAKSQGFHVNMTFENAPTGSKAALDGVFDKQSKGTLTFKTAHFADIMMALFGENFIGNQYNESLDTSFKFEYDKTFAKLNNFVIKYGDKAAGSGDLMLKNFPNNKEFALNLEMTQLDLGIFELIGKDVLQSMRQGKKFADSNLATYNGIIDIKAAHALYNGAEVLNFNTGLTLQNGLLTITRMGLNMPGNTNLKFIGAVNLNENLAFQINQIFETDDLRQFISVFGIDLAKLANNENKKAIFKHAKADIALSGDMNQLKISAPQVNIDSTVLSGDIGFVLNEGKTFVLAVIEGSKILFDKYVQLLPQNSQNLSFKDKFIHQMSLIPWNHELNVDASIALKGAVYNNIPLENMILEFNSYDQAFNIKKLSIANIAGGNLNLQFNADNVYSNPLFSDLSYDVKTENFPQFATALGLNPADIPLFKRKLFVSQGALSGSFDDFNLSSLQKFGDIEFSYAGQVSDASKSMKVNGELELKSNNFTKFVKALNFNYEPDMPVTPFSLAGKISGTADNFAITELNAYLSANAIKGDLAVHDIKTTPTAEANLHFDKFDADRLFNLSKKSIFKSTEQANKGTFLSKPLLNDEKIDYALFKKYNFHGNLSADTLVFNGANYHEANLATVLENGVLHVSQFRALSGNASVELKFDMNSNDLPKIEGTYAVNGLRFPNLKGSLYGLTSGKITASGSFSSLATSPNDFFENLTSKGDFEATNTAFRGWDLAIIKFELEQRDNTEGFEDAVLQSLASGQSSFDKIHGTYDITKGLLVTKNTIWESPVINLDMNLNLNFNNWLFDAVFYGVYHNASFSDVLKFTFDGHLDNPKAKVDLSESSERINKVKKMADKVKNQESIALKNRLIARTTAIQNAVTALQKEVTQMSLDVIRFKPVTNNKDVLSVYDTNIKALEDSEKTLSNMDEILHGDVNEEKLTKIENDLALERTKLQAIPKALEENFVIDSKYVFDDTFNKIAWIYNVAQNNSTYYKNLSDVYMDKIKPLVKQENGISSEDTDKLAASVKKVADDMEKITEVHSKIRDNYLVIIDTVSAADMKENNEIADQALQTLSLYVENMNNDIISSFDMFKATLNIDIMDYEQYIVYPPKNPRDIDITQPTVKIIKEKKETPAEGNKEEAKSQLGEKTTAKTETETQSETKTDAVTDDKKTEAVEENKTSETSEDKKKIDEPVVHDTHQKQTESKSPENLSQNDLESFVQLADLGAGGFTLPQQTANTLQNKETTSVDVVEKDFALADATPLPDAQALVLTENNNTVSSAIDQALHSDIDNNVAALSLQPADTHLTVAEQAKIITEDIAKTINNITPILPDENDKNFDNIDASLKVNPVVAMDIGKSDEDKTLASVSLDNVKKSGFNKVINVKETGVLPEHITQNTLSDLNVNNVPVKKANKQQTVTQDTAVNTEPQTQYVFSQETKDIPFVGIVGKNMLRGKEDTFPLSIAPKKYVFDIPNNVELPFYGETGKNLAKGKTDDADAPILLRQYVFAANNQETAFSGDVGKRMFLGVK